jgi:hypothetical protein
MLTKLDCALMPACTELTRIDGQRIATLDGQTLHIELKPERCKVDEADNRVTLGFALGGDEYAVWMKRRGHWDIEQIARSLEYALRNGNLVSGGEPFGLDAYRHSN